MTDHETRTLERCLTLADKEDPFVFQTTLAMLQYAMQLNAEATGFYFDTTIRTAAKEKWRSYRDILKGAGLWHLPEAQEQAWTHCSEALMRDFKAVNGREGPKIDLELASTIVWKMGINQLTARKKASQRMIGRSAARDRTERVALIYGRDVRAKIEANIIIKSCGLTVVDFELAQRERVEVGHDYIHEIIEELFSQSAAALVVLSAEEDVVLKPEFRSSNTEDSETRQQPRPNVLLELGMALGRFGRNVIVLEFGYVDLPSDLAGLHRVRWRKSRLAVARDVFRQFKKLGLDAIIPDSDGIQVAIKDIRSAND